MSLQQEAVVSEEVQAGEQRMDFPGMPLPEPHSGAQRRMLTELSLSGIFQLLPEVAQRLYSKPQTYLLFVSLGRLGLGLSHQISLLQLYTCV